MSERMKRCTRCGEDKPLGEFSMNFEKRTGRSYPRGACKRCDVGAVVAARAADRETARRKDRARYRRNRVRYLAASRAKHARHRDRENARRRTPARRARGRELAALRRDGLRRGGEAAVAFIRVVLCDPCAYCGATSSQVDHIDAVSRGGSSEWGNLTGACRPCNQAKLDRPLLSFLLERAAA